jgi:hypothetical protein
MTNPSTGRILPRALFWTRLRAVLGRAAWAPLAIALLVPVTACDDAKEAECRKAISNIRKIYGTSDNSFGVSPEAMVRSCQGSTSPESVQCFIQATTVEDLQRCEGDTFKEMFESEKGEQKKQGEQTQDEGAPAQP